MYKFRNFGSVVNDTTTNNNLNYRFNMENISASAFADSKPHYELLDGLRGVAALVVILYHIFEGYAFASNGTIDTLNHGYLAVDFFFILSGLLSVMLMMTVGGKVLL